jgi:hypothetical protein
LGWRCGGRRELRPLDSRLPNATTTPIVSILLVGEWGGGWKPRGKPSCLRALIPRIDPQLMMSAREKASSKGTAGHAPPRSTTSPFIWDLGGSRCERLVPTCARRSRREEPEPPLEGNETRPPEAQVHPGTCGLITSSRGELVFHGPGWQK